jgi:hypothetical protein
MEVDEWKKKAASGDIPPSDYCLQKSVLNAEIKETGDLGIERGLKFIVSRSTVDRDLDTIEQNGWLLDNFRKNPVVPFGHDYKNLPVARALTIGLEDGALTSIAQFVPKDVYPFADTVYEMAKAGFLNAVSAGFRPVKHEMNAKRGGVDFLEQELLEYSVVPIPDTLPVKHWAEEVLDDYHQQKGLWLPQDQVEKLFWTSGTTSKSVQVPEMDAAKTSDAIVKDTVEGEPEYAEPFMPSDTDEEVAEGILESEVAADTAMEAVLPQRTTITIDTSADTETASTDDATIHGNLEHVTDGDCEHCAGEEEAGETPKSQDEVSRLIKEADLLCDELHLRGFTTECGGVPKWTSDGAVQPSITLATDWTDDQIFDRLYWIKTTTTGNTTDSIQSLEVHDDFLSYPLTPLEDASQQLKLTMEGEGGDVEEPVIEKDVMTKVNPTVFNSPLPGSYEALRSQLEMSAPNFLTGNGKAFRPEADQIALIATYTDKAIFCVVGKDRPFDEDPCYKGEFSIDGELGVPSWTGAPTDVNIEVSAHIIQQSAQLQSWKQKDMISAEPTKDADDWFIELEDEPQKAADETTIDPEEVTAILAAVTPELVKEVVREEMTRTIKTLQGRLD